MTAYRGATPVCCTGGADEAEKQALVKGEPDLFFTALGYDGWPVVMLRLAAVGDARLAELVTDAWQMRSNGEP